jgi:GT2 family glycosyltransferase
VKASVIIVIYSGIDRLQDAPQSLAGYAKRSDVEVIIVDNGSVDRCSDEAKRRFPWAKVKRSDVNLGFAGGVNFGAESATGDVIILLNDDAVAEPGLIEAHIEVLSENTNAAASAGRLITWDGLAHDFLLGQMTFDAHAFQIGQGFPLNEILPPERGEPLAFACGGNMAVRRKDWLENDGFDKDLFAYFEDVELAWRLLASGRDIVAAPDAVARHRGSATSDALGNFRRGVLFERNALRTFFACADEELRSAMGSAVMLTFLHRLTRFTELNPELAAHAADPFGAAPEAVTRKERWRRRLHERGLGGSIRHLVARVLLGPSVGLPALTDGHLLMQLRAARGFFDGLDGAQARRRSLCAVRRVPDRELIDRFPRLVVPTYPGDELWFACDAFRALMPSDWGIEESTLEMIHHSSLGGS